MARARWIVPWADSEKKPAIYHCLARVVDKRFAFKITRDTNHQAFACGWAGPRLQGAAECCVPVVERFELTPPENPESPPDGDFASHPNPEALHAAAMVTVCEQAPRVSAPEAVMALPSRPQIPPEDDPPAGNAPKAPQPPPKPPSGGFFLNSLSTNDSAGVAPPPKTMGVTDYSYRYYDPATGRWPSRDPIGGIDFIHKLLALRLTPSLYNSISKLWLNTSFTHDYLMCSNNVTNNIDIVGLLECYCEETTWGAMAGPCTPGEENWQPKTLQCNGPDGCSDRHEKRCLKMTCRRKMIYTCSSSGRTWMPGASSFIDDNCRKN